LSRESLTDVRLPPNPSRWGFQRRSKTSMRASKSARVTNSAISYVVTPLTCGPRSKGRRGHFQVTPLALLGLLWSSQTTAARCPAALHAAPHARPGDPRAALHVQPGDLHAAIDAAPSRPSWRQLVTLLAVAPLSLATIGARRAPQPI